MEGDRGGGEGDRWHGEDWRIKATGAIRIAALNVGRFPMVPDDPKQLEFFDWIRTVQADIIGVSKTGLQWSDLGRGETWADRVRGQFQAEKSRWGWNKRNPVHGKTQWGGTGMVTINRLTAKIQDMGTDHRELGRWTWTMLRGRGAGTVIATVYNPVHNNRSAGSVYMQQVAALAEDGVTEDPRAVLRADLEAQVRTWKEAGKHIIVMGDINEHIYTGQMGKMLEEVGLRPFREDAISLATHQRNTSGTPIDGIWTTPGIEIQASGYTEFSEWDHRTAWIDVTESSIMPPRTIPDLAIDARRLRLGDGDSAARYLKRYRQGVRDSGLAGRVRALDETVGRTLSPAQATELEHLDRCRTAMMLLAERKCRHLKMGKVPYSPATVQPAKEAEFWRLAVRRREGKRVSSRLISRVQKRAGLHVRTAELTLEDLKAKHEAAKTAWTAAKDDAGKQRQAFLERQAELYTANGRGDKATVVRTLMKREEDKEAWRRVRWALKGTNKSGITHVIAPNPDGSRQTHETEEGIVHACIQANRKKYRQTQSTPFMTGQIAEDVGWDGMTDRADTILSGTYPLPAQTAAATAALIEALRKPAEARDWTEEDLTITLTAHKQGWARAKERTASGPSGLHFGMWKANATVDALAEIDRALRAIPYRTGYVLQRWKRGVDVELCKKEGNYNVERLRTIVLLEGDYNMNNKTMSRTLMRKAEADGTFAPEQYGSRNRHSAPSVSLNNRLTDDIMRQTRRGGAYVSNDAKSCYDRIVHSVLSLSLRRMGVAREPIRSLVHTMQQLHHHVKTAHGISDTGYSADEAATPMQGVVQGNAMGPAGWGAVSTPIIEMMRAAGHGFTHTGGTAATSANLVCFAYVDDTDLVHTWRQGVSAEDFLTEVQTVIDTWEGGLHATGGALAPEKSYWHWIGFQWHRGRWHYRTSQDLPGQVTMRGPDGARAPLQRLEPTESRRSLGVMPRRDGSDCDNLALLRHKADAWADKIRTARLTHSEAWRATRGTIWRSIDFPLTTLCATAAELQKATGPAIRTALSKAGVQRRLPRVLVHGPKAMLGLGLPNPHALQLVAHIRAILQHAHAPTLTGQLLRASYEAMHREAGLPGGLLSQVYSKWAPVITDCWWKHTWRDATSWGVRLYPPAATAGEAAWREHDQPVMEMFVKQGFTGGTLARLNRCRIQLRVMWLSEIATACGRRLRDGVKTGSATTAATRPGTWPKAPPITPADWRLWRKTLDDFVLDDYGRLKTVLGKFYPDGEHRQWIWWTDEGGFVYNLAEDGWHQWGCSRQGQLTEVGTQAPTGNTKRVTVRVTAVGLARESVEIRPSFPADPDEGYTLGWSSRGATVDWEAWTEALRSRTAVAVSDGSWKEGLGTAAYRVGHGQGSGLVPLGQGSAIIRPGLTASGSHRAELAGLHGVMAVVRKGSERLTGGAVHIACDSTSAMRCLDRSWHFTADKADYDLLVAVQHKVQQALVDVYAHYVKGHQDNTGKQLNCWEMWNVDMDTLAKAVWMQASERGAHTWPTNRVYGPAWEVTVNGKWIQGIESNAIHAELTGPDTNAYWCHRTGNPAGWRHVDWAAIRQAVGMVPETTAVWLTKHLSNNSGSSATMTRWKFRPPQPCSRCGAATEDSDHIHRCRGPGTAEVWEKYVSAITASSVVDGLSLAMTTAMIDGLHRWRNGDPPPAPTGGDPLSIALRAQTQLGWEQMVKGFLATHWRAVQGEMDGQRDRKRRRTRWMARLAKCGWTYMRDMWDHRNESFHAADSAANTGMEELLDDKIRKEKEAGGADLPELIRDVWAADLHQLLQASVPHRQHWLRVIRAGRHLGTRWDYRHSRGGLDSWMSTGRL